LLVSLPDFTENKDVSHAQLTPSADTGHLLPLQRPAVDVAPPCAGAPRPHPLDAAVPGAPHADGAPPSPGSAGPWPPSLRAASPALLGSAAAGGGPAPRTADDEDPALAAACGAEHVLLRRVSGSAAIKHAAPPVKATSPRRAHSAPARGSLAEPLPACARPSWTTSEASAAALGAAAPARLLLAARAAGRARQARLPTACRRALGAASGWTRGVRASAGAAASSGDRRPASMACNPLFGASAASAAPGQPGCRPLPAVPPARAPHGAHETFEERQGAHAAPGAAGGDELRQAGALMRQAAVGQGAGVPERTGGSSCSAAAGAGTAGAGSGPWQPPPGAGRGRGAAEQSRSSGGGAAHRAAAEHAGPVAAAGPGLDAAALVAEHRAYLARMAAELDQLAAHVAGAIEEMGSGSPLG